MPTRTIDCPACADRIVAFVGSTDYLDSAEATVRRRGLELVPHAAWCAQRLASWLERQLPWMVLGSQGDA